MLSVELVHFSGLITSRTPRAVVPVWVPSKSVGERAQKLQSCPLWLYVCGVQYRGPVDTCEGEIMVFKKFRLVQISLQVQIHPGALCEREGGSLLSPVVLFLVSVVIEYSHLHGWLSVGLVSFLDQTTFPTPWAVVPVWVHSKSGGYSLWFYVCAF